MNQNPDHDWKENARLDALTCRREILQQLRRAKGWTQARLAEVVGYSERLISKAERGEPLALSTIEDLAMALSTEERQIYPEDLVTDPLLRTREIALLLQQHRQAAANQLENWLDEEVALHVAGHRKNRHCPQYSQGREQVLGILKYLWIEVGGKPLALHDIRCVGTGREVSIWWKIVRIGSDDSDFLTVQTCLWLEFHRGLVQRIELMLDAAAWKLLTAETR